MSSYVEMQELREEIDSLKEEIQKLKIEKTNDSTDFVPEEGLNYYTINSKGGIQEDIWSNYKIDINFIILILNVKIQKIICSGMRIIF